MPSSTDPRWPSRATGPTPQTTRHPIVEIREKLDNLRYALEKFDIQIDGIELKDTHSADRLLRLCQGIGEFSPHTDPRYHNPEHLASIDGVVFKLSTRRPFR